MPLPGITAVAAPQDDLLGLLGRVEAVLRGVAQADPEEPLGPLQLGIVERLWRDVRAALGS